VGFSFLKGINVANQLLSEFQNDARAPFLLRDILPGAAWAPFGTKTGDQPSEMDFSSEAAVEEENCPRGLLVATCLEVVLLLGIYGGWQVLHLAR
jgi:hypothetical protein